MAVVPHFKCEKWLAGAISSLLDQTRPLQAVAVIDDGSISPPIDIVRRFPAVTLLASAQNVGPYRLVQGLIDQTDYDAFLFQDADDWSIPTRLERLLVHAEATGAELVGSHAVRIDCTTGRRERIKPPADVNEALERQPTADPMCHPACLVSRDLVVEIGGYSTGLRFGGDTEFLRRVHHVARVVNLPEAAYCQRRRPDSLTTSAQTGSGSPARLLLQRRLNERAIANACAVARGERPDLRPLETAGSVVLHHVAGPRLNKFLPSLLRPRLNPRSPRPAGQKLTPLGEEAILGPSKVVVKQALEWALTHQASDALLQLIPLIWEISGTVRPEVMLAQFVHETGWLYREPSPEGVDATFCNPCGLKTSSSGAEGASHLNVHKRFPSWKAGFSAQRDHLRLYAGDLGTPLSDTLDPRHFPYLTGTARTVEELGGRWALSPQYGYQIASKFLAPLLSTAPATAASA